MKPGLQFAWLVLILGMGVAVGAALDREFSRTIEMQLKNFPEGVSQLPQN